MKQLLLISAAIACTFSASAALADTTGGLFRKCMNFPRKEHEFHYCMGYMAGVHDIMIVKRDLLNCGDRSLAEINDRDLIGEFITWAKANTERWEEPAYKSMVDMMNKNYPCPRNIKGEID